MSQLPGRMNIVGVASAAFALLVWGVTFANTRVLLLDFSALEIMVVRFAMAWAVLLGMERAARWSAPTGVKRLARGASPTGGRGEWLFWGMGLTGVFVYQFLENCAIYYTNASNVAILVSFGPIITALIVLRGLSPVKWQELLFLRDFLHIKEEALRLEEAIPDFKCVNPELFIDTGLRYEEFWYTICRREKDICSR